MQQILKASENYEELDTYFLEKRIEKIFIVCGKSFNSLQISKYFESLCDRTGLQIIYFSEFSPNPKYEAVVDGVKAFVDSGCDAIVAIGGGSAMDVAKCIKLFSNMDDNEVYLKQNIVPNSIPFLAIPTTAGTGSEATRYAVIYYNGEKQSVTHESAIPDAVLMDADFLKSLPDYQRKVTMLDALGHAIESFWSVNSTDESKGYSRQAIQMIFDNMDGYLANTSEGNNNMLKAAYIAGRAINITQTTAGHAMAYKITSLYGATHGHAVALCLRVLFPYMLSNTKKCIDSRGEKYLEDMFSQLAAAMGCCNAGEAVKKFVSVFDYLKLEIPKANRAEIEVLKKSVNVERLKNNPVKLDNEDIEYLYCQILGKKE